MGHHGFLRTIVHSFSGVVWVVTEWSRYGGANPVNTPEVIPA